MNQTDKSQEFIDPFLGSELGIYVQRVDSIKIFESRSLETAIAEGFFLDNEAKPAKFFVHPGSLGFSFRSYILLSHGYIFEGILKTPIGDLPDVRIYVPNQNISVS